MARIKPYRLNQAGIVCNVNDSTAIAIRSVDENAGFVVMPEKYFEAGRFAHEADGWWGGNADHSQYDKEEHRARLKNLVQVAEDFVREQAGEVGLAVFKDETDKRLKRYWT